METKHELGALNIQLFADGGAVGEGASVGDLQSGENNAEINSANPDAGDNASQQSEGNTAEGDLDSFYEKHPEAKKEADRRTNKAVQGRIRQVKASYQESDAFIQKLMVRHNVQSVGELNKLYDSDEFFENMAAEKGENPETLREIERLKMIERRMNEHNRNVELDRLANERYNNWIQEAEPLKASYPGFDLDKELENKDFRDMLNKNVSMDHAYKIVHHEELIKAAENAVAEKISKNVNSRATRPDENGLGNHSSAAVKNDVSKLTKKERAEFAKRAARGEMIDFRT